MYCDRYKKRETTRLMVTAGHEMQDYQRTIVVSYPEMPEVSRVEQIFRKICAIERQERVKGVYILTHGMYINGN